MKTTQELKEIYEANPDEWIKIQTLKNKSSWKKFNISDDSIWMINTYDYQLIHINHKEILEAYLADNDVDIQVYFEDEWFKQLNFIEYYDPDLEYKLKEKEDGLDRIGHSNSTNSVLCSVTGDNSGKPLNNFKDFGFTADFEGEILKEVDGWYIGWVRIKDIIYTIQWNAVGQGFLLGWNSIFDLTPIKKEWYENPENFPAVMFHIASRGFIIINTQGRFFKDCFDSNNEYKHDYILATKAERDSLYIGEER